MTSHQIPRFLKQCVIIDDTVHGGLDITALYGRYLSWCLTIGAEPLVSGDFATAVRHLGIRHDDEQGPTRYYPGMKIADPLTKSGSGKVRVEETPGGVASAEGRDSSAEVLRA